MWGLAHVGKRAITTFTLTWHIFYTHIIYMCIYSVYIYHTYMKTTDTFSTVKGSSGPLSTAHMWINLVSMFSSVLFSPQSTVLLYSASVIVHLFMWSILVWWSVSCLWALNNCKIGKINPFVEWGKWNTHVETDDNGIKSSFPLDFLEGYKIRPCLSFFIHI